MPDSSDPMVIFRKNTSEQGSNGGLIRREMGGSQNPLYRSLIVLPPPLGRGIVPPIAAMCGFLLSDFLR